LYRLADLGVDSAEQPGNCNWAPHLAILAAHLSIKLKSRGVQPLHSQLAFACVWGVANFRRNYAKLYELRPYMWEWD